jgi:hypothetical protein
MDRQNALASDMPPPAGFLNQSRYVKSRITLGKYLNRVRSSSLPIDKKGGVLLNPALIN